MDTVPVFPQTASGRLPGAEPFSLGDGPVGCLLVHGFTSTPHDVRACGEYLAARGIATEGVLLAGHGTRPEDLARTQLADWLRSIREGYARLASRCPNVFALGISLSGNFLLALAPYTPFAGLILVGTPLRFRYQHAYWSFYRLLRLLGQEYQKKWYLQHLDPDIRIHRPTYDRFPLRCAPDCLAAIHWSRAALHAVTCPVLVLQSTTDHAVDERTTEDFRSGLVATNLTVRWFSDRYHVLLIDHGADEVFGVVADFIRTRPQAPHAQPATRRKTWSSHVPPAVPAAPSAGFRESRTTGRNG